MRLIDADALLTERRKQKYYHLPNGDTAIPIIDIEHAPTVDVIRVGVDYDANDFQVFIEQEQHVDKAGDVTTQTTTRKFRIERKNTVAETMKNSEGQIWQFSTPEDWKPVQSETKSACSNCTNKKKKNGEICVCLCTLGTPEITC